MGEPTSAGKRRARLKVINPRSAGIDVGSRFHVVAVPAELDPDPVRKFSSFTKDLIALAEWLLAVGISTIAMESTGICQATAKTGPALCINKKLPISFDAW